MKPMLKVEIKTKPSKQEPEAGESMAHESGESPEMEKTEDMMPEEGEEDGGEECGFEAQCDANDLLRAAEIKGDPARLKEALKVIGQKKKAIDSMEELMAVRKEKMLSKKP